jgi:hypothetical protein
MLFRINRFHSYPIAGDKYLSDGSHIEKGRPQGGPDLYLSFLMVKEQ